MPKKKLIIFPFNGNGIEALDCINFDDYELVGFVDDDQQKRADLYEIFTRDILQRYKELFVLAVPGSATSFQRRKEIIASLELDRSRYITAIHPKAAVGRNVKIGANCLVMAGAVITSNACIKDHVCILPNSVIHHDVVVEEYTLIGSNVVVAGGTLIGKNCYIGSGSNVMNGISIGDGALIGLGSNVLKSVTGNAKMAGNPARDLNEQLLSTSI
ncbi:NeuD/PglB/VioB family sugar acetyltransferase [Pontibacter ramchanderi]|uniref:Sugar O-acyltransferase (Sialic acid O-acetyltransferase NeuD family) n=1 Tax=Pontibacter ramchanderi TaxID=1179743 RepID=A0A2N3V1L9_9BACT|nr:NeuD/PglB/VioB family sugar acetyltransferase [Pontibacter ramchanderi]PKV75514.1 sugar O-acyltransferase (sialic acid O-acetyltransferase NeuD family) [Pontibacter ramchanderi]